MKGYKNYRITLEHVTDSEIECIDYAECVTEKQARKIMAKMSNSKKAKDLRSMTNRFGDLPNVVRVYAISNEDDNAEFVQGVHIMMFENGICTYSSAG